MPCLLLLMLTISSATLSRCFSPFRCRFHADDAALRLFFLRSLPSLIISMMPADFAMLRFLSP